MTKATNDTKKQWAKPGFQQLEGTEAERVRELIYSLYPEAKKSLPEPKRGTG